MNGGWMWLSSRATFWCLWLYGEKSDPMVAWGWGVSF